MLIMRCVIFTSTTKRRFHITSQFYVCLGDLLRMRTLCDTFHTERVVLDKSGLEIEESPLVKRACLPIKWKIS